MKENEIIVYKPLTYQETSSALEEYIEDLDPNQKVDEIPDIDNKTLSSACLDQESDPGILLERLNHITNITTGEEVTQQLQPFYLELAQDPTALKLFIACQYLYQISPYNFITQDEMSNDPALDIQQPFYKLFHDFKICMNPPESIKANWITKVLQINQRYNRYRFDYPKELHPFAQKLITKTIGLENLERYKRINETYETLKPIQNAMDGIIPWSSKDPESIQDQLLAAGVTFEDNKVNWKEVSQYTEDLGISTNNEFAALIRFCSIFEHPGVQHLEETFVFLVSMAIQNDIELDSAYLDETFKELLLVENGSYSKSFKNKLALYINNEFDRGNSNIAYKLYSIPSFTLMLDKYLDTDLTNTEIASKEDIFKAFGLLEMHTYIEKVEKAFPEVVSRSGFKKAQSDQGLVKKIRSTWALNRNIGTLMYNITRLIKNNVGEKILHLPPYDDKSTELEYFLTDMGLADNFKTKYPPKTKDEPFDIKAITKAFKGKTYRQMILDITGKDLLKELEDL